VHDDFRFGVEPCIAAVSGAWREIFVQRERKVAEGVYTSEKASYNLPSLLIAELPEGAEVL
jgi:hypothetical protein